MRKLIIKSALIGCAIGTAFFVIAPFGLGLPLIESLKPVLTPGVTFMHLLGQNTLNAASQITSFFLNGLIYSILVLGIFLLRNRMSRSD